ncbi:hypothetical protein FSP39_012139 [Pinctada imbricata]|uniref:Uncharacterized protein n=1 Tax=Pinctada imbricata TaxID=66713 RepID=A0AA88XK23_PINIB|nr:hypothetical protein FSP39_012139 [Pinctada imbricata]
MSEIVPVPIKFDKKHLKQKISTISQNEDIKVQPSNNKTGVRVWDKLHFCLYCENSYTNITKHYLGRHKDETEIQRILAMKLGSKERKSALLKIRNSGDYKHNTDVLEKGSGTVITWTRKEEKTSHSNYLPCEDCLGFFLKANLWRHRKQCPFKKTDVVGANKRCQSQASLLLPSSIGVCTGLKEKVLSRMSTDEVTMVVRNDPIIIRVGEKLFQKHGQLPHLYSHISQKMRELGRFLLSVRKEDPETSTMSKLLVPEKYPLAVKATQSLCGYGNKDNTYSNPSLALKIGHLLKKCCKVKIYKALISRTETNDAEKFCRLCEEYWEDDVSNAALQTLRTEKRSKGNILPLTEDIRKVQNLLKEKSRSMAEKLSKSFTKAGWDTLNQATLASLVIFNRRRGGETERITVDNYRNVKLKHTADSIKEVEEALSPVEKVMCRTIQRIEIRGKKGRTVPVLLPTNLREHIEVLLQHRQEAGVHKDNKYLFPRSSFDSLNPLRSADCLRRFANEADLSFPENLTSTKLRKHVATISQVLDLSKSDLENMANFLGHDIEVHRSFYRIPQETLQVAKMGRLLTAFDNGTVSKYSGKPLDEIPVDEAASSSSHEPQSSRSQQSSQEPQSSRSQQSSQEQQASTSDSSSSLEPQSSRSQQSSQEPQSSRSQQSSQEPQASSENFSFLE